VGGGSEPSWSRDNRELFYRSAAGDLVAVRVMHEPTFSTGTATVLFPAEQYTRNPARRQYEVSPDGRRFLMIRPLGGGVEGQLILVQNFLDELRNRVPD
jgi:hypothetical protein